MKKWKIILLVFLGVLLLFEAVLRVFYDAPLSEVRRPRANAYMADSIINYRFLPGAEYVHPISGEVFRINGDGFPGREFPEPEAGRFRLAILGNSMISGDFKQAYQTNFCLELQAIADSLQVPLDVMNFGIDGGTRNFADFLAIRHYIPDYCPDMILLQYTLPFSNDQRVREYYRGCRISYQLNDLVEKKKMEKAVDRYLPWEGTFNFLLHSHIVKFIFRMQQKFAFAPRELGRYVELYVTGQTSSDVKGRIHYTLEESVDMIKELQGELKEQGIAFFLFSIIRDPDTFAFARENELPFIAINAELELSDFFPKDHHPNRTGNRKIAERTFTLLDSYDLIRPKTELYPVNR